MNDPQAFPGWLVPLFPVFFVAMWLLVCAILAEMGGWSELARTYRDPDGAARAPLESFWRASLGLIRGWLPVPTSYNNCVIVEITAAGLHLRTWLPFRFRHPPLFIPWMQVERVEHGRILFFPTLVVQPGGVGTRIHMYGRPARAMEQVWQQLTARPAAV